MEKRLASQPKPKETKKSDGSRYVDFSGWPAEFDSLRSCIDTYNKLGLYYKIMFKVGEHLRDNNGLTRKFSLVCLHRSNTRLLPQSLVSKSNTGEKGAKCPVVVHFRFKPYENKDRGGRYVRNPNAVM